MIKAAIYRNKVGDIYGFEIKDHAASTVCAAVSIMVQNTANSFEKFVPHISYSLKYDDGGGYFFFEVKAIKEGMHDRDADLLLKSFELALEGIELEYGDEIKVVHKRR